MTERFQCESCNQPKRELRKVPSRLLEKDLLMCPSCIKDKFEPRYIVVLAHLAGNDKVHSFIRNKQYYGAEITLREAI